MGDLVSIIIPVFNSRLTIERCILSIINQTYKNIEIIVVNDGSTDNTLEILHNFKDERLKIITINNAGVSNARNIGIEKSKGKYIIFVDSDDWISELMVEKMIEKKKKYNMFCICNYYIFFSNNDEMQIKSEPKEDKISICELQKDFYELYENRKVINSPWGKLYDSYIIKSNNLQFDVNLSLGEDLIFNLKYMSFIDKLCFIEDKMYFYYRTNEYSLSRKYYKNMLEIQEKIKNCILEYSNRIKCDKIERIYLKCLKLLMSAVSNELHNKNNGMIKRISCSKKVYSNEVIQDYANFLYKHKFLKRMPYFIINNKMILGYFCIKDKI